VSLVILRGVEKMGSEATQILESQAMEIKSLQKEEKGHSRALGKLLSFAGASTVRFRLQKECEGGAYMRKTVIGQAMEIAPKILVDEGVGGERLISQGM